MGSYCWNVYSWGVYSWGMALHRALTRRRALPKPVISVGGLSVGGAGKTPVTAWLAQALRAKGWRVVILSRGYGRSGAGIALVQPEQADAATIFGDEPVWLAKNTGAAVVVGKSRWKAGMWACDHLKADVFLLDDGFQHWGLQRDFDLVVLDAMQDPENLRILPWGPYREGLGSLHRAHAVLLNRCNQTPSERLLEWRKKLTGRLLFEAALQPGSAPWMQAKKVALLSATASPASFRKTVSASGIEVVGHLKLRDHEPLSIHKIQAWATQMAACGAEQICITEKDAVKLQCASVAGLPVCAVPVQLALQEPALLIEQIEQRCKVLAC